MKEIIVTSTPLLKELAKEFFTSHKLKIIKEEEEIFTLTVKEFLSKPLFGTIPELETFV